MIIHNPSTGWTIGEYLKAFENFENSQNIHDGHEEYAMKCIETARNNVSQRNSNRNIAAQYFMT